MQNVKHKMATVRDGKEETKWNTVKERKYSLQSREIFYKDDLTH